jgi:hypothetical protein
MGYCCKGKTDELTQSSKASLIRETRSTIDSGATFVIGLTGLIGVIDRHEIPRKYMFAMRLNCSNRPLGRNVKTLYFVVEIELPLNRTG